MILYGYGSGDGGSSFGFGSGGGCGYGDGSASGYGNGCGDGGYGYGLLITQRPLEPVIEEMLLVRSYTLMQIISRVLLARGCGKTKTKNEGIT